MTSGAPARRWGEALPAIGASAIVVVLAVVAEIRGPLNGDAHWILTMAGRLLGGEQLYRDILEINPPLIVWLQVPIVWLARAAGLAPAAVYRGVVLAICGISAAATVRLLLRSRFAVRRPVLAWWMAPALLFVLLLIPAGAFGQREQIITALLLPLVALTVLRLEGAAVSSGVAIATGIAAGIAIALKPFFIVFWVLLAAVRSLQSRRTRLNAEDLAIVGIGAAYLAAVIVAVPGFFRVVRVFGPTYAAFTTARSVADLLGNAAAVWAGAALVAWVVRRDREDAVGLVLAASVIGAFIAAMLQGKGWTYHFVPAICFSVLLGFAALASRGSSGTRAARISRAVAALLLLVSWAPLLQRTASRFGPGAGKVEEPVGQLSSVVARERPARSILVLSADMTSALPWIAELGLVNRASFPFLWVPAVVYRTRWNGNPTTTLREHGAMSEAERTAYDAVVSDFVRHTPDLLAVETRYRNEHLTGYPGGFDHLVYYGRDPRFAACFMEYRLVAALQDYLVFRRQDSSGPARKDCGDGG